MSSHAIEVTGLAKRYELGAGTFARYRTLRESLEDAARAAIRRIRHGNSASARTRTLWALEDVSFNVSPGEVVGIIGRNGAGKSTLLKILSRITEPTRGRVRIEGRLASLLEVGTGFHAELTGRENIYLNGAILGMSRREIQSKFDAIVAYAELESHIDTPVKRFSSGQYVRLAFAVAAHLEPEILVVDEVLAVGDYEFQQKCIGTMGDISRDGRTVLIVSHNMGSIRTLCSRAILLAAGRVVVEGSPTEVVARYTMLARGAAGEVVWIDPEDAPGNENVRLHAVRILQDDEAVPVGEVDIAKPITVQILYWNSHSGTPLYPGIWLKDSSGTFVLSSSNHASISLTPDPWSGKPFPRGLFESRCVIPANFLNDGLYSVTPIVGKGIADTQVIQHDVISFHVYDTGAMRQEYKGSWAGPVIRPRLAWTTSLCESLPLGLETQHNGLATPYPPPLEKEIGGTVHR